VKRICILLVAILLAAVSASALASAHSTPPAARSALFSTVELHNTRLGKILVNAAGSILYVFSKDHTKQSSCAKIKGCPAVWPAMPVAGKPSAGSGVRASRLSTIATPEGIRQVTYAGHPLYIYAAAPKLISYVGVKQFGGNWYALNASGQIVK